jgi:hypothetical protein
MKRLIFCLIASAFSFYWLDAVYSHEGWQMLLGMFLMLSFIVSALCLIGFLSKKKQVDRSKAAGQWQPDDKEFQRVKLEELRREERFP